MGMCRDLPAGYAPACVDNMFVLAREVCGGYLCRELQGKLVVPLQPYFEKWAAALARKKVEDAADAHTGARMLLHNEAPSSQLFRSPYRE